MREKKFRVPDYDVIIKPHELLVINTPTFQRLFRVYQLGLTYMIYPFATHTRAAHTIETLNYTQKFVDSLTRKHSLSGEIIDIIRMSALLHDIAHLPFSHTFEDENIVFKEKHDKKERVAKFLDQLKSEIVEPERKMLSLLEPDKTTRKYALNLVEKAKRVLLTISYSDKDKQEQERDKVKPEDLLKLDEWFVADIVGNTICADLLAYIKRDVEYTGIEKKHGGYRIFDYLEIKEDKDRRKRLAIHLVKAGFRIDVFSAILDILDVRYALMERVVFHHAKCAAGSMLARAARLIDLRESKDLYKMGDELFLDHLLKNSNDAARHLIERLNSRIFYKRIYKVTRGERIEYDKSHAEDFCSRFRDSGLCTEFENHVEDKFHLPRGTISVFCPEKDMHLKEARVMVDWGKGYVFSLNDDNFKNDYPEFWKRVDQIEEKYKDLWVFYVFIEPDEFGKAALIQEYLHEQLKVRNDPLLDLYLEEKEVYTQSKEFVAKASKASIEIKSAALDGLLKEVAWDKKYGSWEEASERAIETAMGDHLSNKTTDKEEKVKRPKQEKLEEPPLFKNTEENT